MDDLRQVAEMALDILDMCFNDEEDEVYWHREKLMDVRKALRQALAQPEQEPVAYRCWNNHKNADGTFDTLRIWTSLKPEGYGNEPLYTAPPKKEWVGLDVEKFAELVRADEREACAKVCDEILEHTKKLGNNDAMLTAISCAVAILARGEK